MRYRTISINLFVPAHARENARTRRHIIFYIRSRVKRHKYCTILELKRERNKINKDILCVYIHDL